MDGFYEVEKILNHRRSQTGKGLEYFLKWKGYPDSENSWEPEENVTDDLIVPYLEEVQRKEKKRKLEISNKSVKKSIPSASTNKSSRSRGEEKDVASNSSSDSVRKSVRSRKIPRRHSPEQSGMVSERQTDTTTEGDEDLTEEDRKIKKMLRGLKLKKIDGICLKFKQPYFKVMWENDPKVDLIPLKTCNKLYPQNVIAYYEKYITFGDKKAPSN